MKFLFELVLYMIIGGMLMTPAVVAMEKKCPNDPPAKTEEFALAVVVWPAFLVAAVITKPGDLGKVECKVEEEEADE